MLNLSVSEFQQLVFSARDAIQSRRLFQPSVACVLGSGLGGLADQVSHASAIDYESIPGFTKTHAAGHAGRLITGYIGCKAVAIATKGTATYSYSFLFT
jgi:purine nucleoside phosphorylase